MSHPAAVQDLMTSLMASLQTSLPSPVHAQLSVMNLSQLFTTTRGRAIKDQKTRPIEPHAAASTAAGRSSPPGTDPNKTTCPTQVAASPARCLLSGPPVDRTEPIVENNEQVKSDLQDRPDDQEFLQRVVVFLGPAPATCPYLVLLASSRLGSEWTQRSDLADAVRTLMGRLTARGAGLITGQGMTCRDLSVHGSHAFACPCWEWIPPPADDWEPWTRWLTGQLDCGRPWHPGHHRLFLSPPLIGAPVGQGPEPKPAAKGTSQSPLQAVDELPIADRLAFWTADEFRILSVKNAGHTWTLSHRALEREEFAGQVHVFLTSRGRTAPEAGGPAENPPEKQPRTRRPASERAALQLMARGAVGWHFPTAPADSCRSASPNVPEWASGRVCAFQSGDAEDFLSHHTRGCTRQWPEETEAEFWWRWLMESKTSQGPGDSLLRIVCQRRLRAGGHLIPGGRPMVCFSGRCPQESVAARQFRSHLRRWDYEPYGVAIRRDRLMAAGARQVEYLESGTAQHEFQQPRYSRQGRGSMVDWSHEQEYRVPGDLDLRQFDRDDLFYFVPTWADAQRLAAFTHCDIKYLDIA